MTGDKRFIVGMDLGRKFSQASYYIDGMKEPESVILGFASQSYFITTEGYKKKGENKWSFGDTGKKYYETGEYTRVERIMDKVSSAETILVDGEQYLPTDILECFVKFILRECVRVTDVERPDKIAICVDNFNQSILDSIMQVLESLEFSKEDVIFFNKTECFVYYTLNAEEDLYKRGVGMMDFNDRRLLYSYMNYAVLDKKTVVMVDSQLEEVKNADDTNLDNKLTKLGMEMMGRQTMSSIYLTGYGFEENGHLDEFIKTVCDRKRAFMGQNMYAKGACIGAFETFYGDAYRSRIVACEDRILSDIDIEIVDKGNPKLFRVTRAGTNWYMATRSIRFIVDEAESLEIHIKSIENKKDIDVSISLDEFPKRPKRMTKILMEIEFSGPTRCRIALKDLGFGDYYKSTGKTIYREIKI